MEAPVLLGGRYELRSVVGVGGMAEVRDGWDTRLRRTVAVKLMHPGMRSQPDIRERFTGEARAAAGLNHPNIVAVHDFGDHRGTPFIVMERLPGATFADQIAAGPLPQAQVSAALASVLAALSAAHSTGMLHRDVKPSNILLTSTGSMKLADFGIAKIPGAAQTTTGQLIGTLAYLSPARLIGAPASVADDLYAVGVVGYEALTGRKPFPQADIGPLTRAILDGTPPSLQALRPDVDPALVEVIERATSRDPSRRFVDADAMRAALQFPIVSGVVPITPRPALRPPTKVLEAPYDSTGTAVIPPPRPPKSPLRKAIGAAAVLIASGVALIAFILEPSSTTPPASPVPVSVDTTVPTSPATTAAAPVSQPPSPAPAPIQSGPENGKGHGNGPGDKPRKHPD